MRIGFGGYVNETNSLCGILNTLEMLKKEATEKDALLQECDSKSAYISGFVAQAQEMGIAPVPGMYVFFPPSGPSTREAFEYGRDRMVQTLLDAHQEAPLDGIALYLHGAGVAEGYPDIETEILRAFRAAFGQNMPIGLVMDLHGNISESTVALADVVVGCKTYPHVDGYQVARQTFRHLINIIRTGKKPYKRLIRLPMHMAVNGGVTTGGPAKEIRELMEQLERDDPELLQASAFQGFPYADIPDAGVSVITMGATQEAADRNALHLAKAIWEQRAQFILSGNSAEQAVALALQAPDGPVLIYETADNPGAGTPGDGTHLLREFLKADVPAAFGYIYDPQVAEQAAKAGVGATIRCSLGGKHIPINGAPLELEAYVKTVSDGRSVHKSPVNKGSPVEMRTTVCLEVGKVQIVVGSSRRQTFDDVPFILGGVDWQQMRLLGLKSSQHFKAWWGDKVHTMIAAEPPGIVSGNLNILPLENVNRDYYPLNMDRQWRPEIK